MFTTNRLAGEWITLTHKETGEVIKFQVASFRRYSAVLIGVDYPDRWNVHIRLDDSSKIRGIPQFNCKVKTRFSTVRWEGDQIILEHGGERIFLSVIGYTQRIGVTLGVVAGALWQIGIVRLERHAAAEADFRRK